MLNNARKALVLLVVSTAAAGYANAVRPDRLPWLRDPNVSANPGENLELRASVMMSLDELRTHVQSASATFVDARKSDEYAAGHLAGAINIPSTEKEMHLDTIFQTLPRDGLIVIYCGGGHCEASNEVFEFLVSNGFDKANLRLFEPGWEVLGRQPDLPTATGME
ncbi:MAG: rhodanese-like domain-containing protein [Phycisphaerae bacterium]|nr:rhodanese-like domain-containing protein [Phycisphaerae bacterium]